MSFLALQLSLPFLVQLFHFNICIFLLSLAICEWRYYRKHNSSSSRDQKTAWGACSSKRLVIKWLEASRHHLYKSSRPKTWSSGPKSWLSVPKSWSSCPKIWSFGPKSWSSRPKSWSSYPKIWSFGPKSWWFRTKSWSSRPKSSCPKSR